jgi:hypothetical protein
MARIIRTNVVSRDSTNLSSANLSSTNITSVNLSSVNLSSDNLSINRLAEINVISSGNIYVGGDLFVNGSFTTTNVTELNTIKNNISTGSLSISGMSTFQNVIANKIKLSTVLASSSIGIGTNLPTSTLDIKGDHIVSINLQNNSSIAARTKIYSYNDGNTYIQSSGDILYTNINSTLLRSICLKVDGKVGIGTTQPSATLDVNGSANFTLGITTGSLCIPTNGDTPVIDTNLYNHLMIYEDFLEESLRSTATTFGNVVYSQYSGNTTGYLELTQNNQLQLGLVYWNVNVGNAFTLTFEHFAGGGNGADEISFAWGGTSHDNGYEISFNEYRSAIELLYNSQRMAYYPITSLDNSEWHTSTIIFYRNIIRVIHNGNQVLAHLDTSRDLSNKNYIGFKGRSGGNTNYHRIKNIRLSKFGEGLWAYQSTTSSNIIYNNGSIGIGLTNPRYKLDINNDKDDNDDTLGAMRIQNNNPNGYASIEYNCGNVSWNSGVGGNNVNSLSNSFYINNCGGSNSSFIGKTNGFWGINTKIPSASLHVHNNSNSIDGSQKVMSLESSEEFATFYGSDNLKESNSALTAMKIGMVSSTGRSINASGSINTNGSGYAEYFIKNNTCQDINKGDICGIDSDSKLTDNFDDAITFVVKSTNPGYVVGDNWVNKNIGECPEIKDFMNEEVFNEAVNAWKYNFEEQRKKVDRIAFCGCVPVNVYNATVGDYIVPSRKGDNRIECINIAKNNITFEQYRIAIGIVVKILEDGRAYIIIKIV